MYIKGSSGNVGIGTTSPNAKLEVNGDIECAPGPADITNHAHGRIDNNVTSALQDINEGDFVYFYLANGTLIAKLKVYSASNSGSFNINFERHDGNAMGHWGMWKDGNGNLLIRNAGIVDYDSLGTNSLGWPGTKLYAGVGFAAVGFNMTSDLSMTYTTYDYGLGVGEVGWFIRTDTLWNGTLKNNIILKEDGTVKALSLIHI